MYKTITKYNDLITGNIYISLPTTQWVKQSNITKPKIINNIVYHDSYFYISDDHTEVFYMFFGSIFENKNLVSVKFYNIKNKEFHLITRRNIFDVLNHGLIKELL